MGIQQTKSLLKTYYSKSSPKDPDEYLQKGFNAEALQLNEFLESFWDTHASEYFDWTNIQENKKPEEIQKEKDKFYLREKYLVPDLPLNHTTTDSLFSIEPISEYKEAYNSSDTKYFSNTFIKRMNIVLIAYIRKILSTYNENSTLECIAKYFDSLQEDNTHKFDLEIGMNLFVKMLGEIADKNLRLKEETLDFLLSNSQFIRPLSFWGETKRHFILDKSLNELIFYLKKIISDKNENSSFRQKAFKILLNLGLAKGSLKNLLDFTDAYQFIDEYIDLNYEFNLFKNEFIKLSLSYPTEINKKVKSKLWGFKLSSSKKKEGEEAAKSDHVSMTNDGNYIYLFSSCGFLTKLGSGYNNTMLGKVYQLKENYRLGEKGTLAYVEGILYYRSSNIDPNPLICIDPDTLEEIPIKYELNIREPNHLWVEGKKNDFEFPHTSYTDMTEIIEKKKNFGAEDKSNSRPSTSSPLISDGRYIYIFSKWYDEVDVNFDKQVDDDDDEPKAQNKKTSFSIYGVDVYDPLDNMSNVKSVKFNLSKQKSSSISEDQEVNLLSPNTIYYTNGNIFVAGPYKFSLSTGEEFEKSPGYTEHLRSCSYDLNNNVIWGLTFKLDGSSEKIEMYCYFNHSAKPIVEYPENHEKYMPCSLEKIISYAEELIKVKNYTNQVSSKTFIRENTLNILGLQDFSNSVSVSQNLIIDRSIKESIQLETYKKSTQCLILSTIAKLSEYYGQVPDMRSANTDEERGKILVQATRRPYCVKLEPETFEILIKFINELSQRFFNKDLNVDTDLRKLENYCLLSTVKILRTNLYCLSISNLELDFFIKNKLNNPFLKMKEFIFKIFETYHSNILSVIKEDSDIIKALYEECKIILQVSVNTLYPDYCEIIDILEREIQNFKESKYSKDIVKCVLEWMSSEENMKILLLRLKKDQISRIFNIFEIVSSWEVQNFSKFIKAIKNLKSLPKYSQNSDDEVIAFKFSSNMQIEILKSLSKKLLNDNYEDIEQEQILHQFSTIIFENIVEVFRSLRIFLEKVPNIIDQDYDELHGSKDEEEIIDTCKPISNDNRQPTQTLEEYKKLKYKEIWNFLIDKVLNNDLLILRTFNFHIDCLSILSSNFIISSLMLNSYNQIIEEMNLIFSLLKECDRGNLHQEFNDYKEIVFESEHPYLPSQTKWFTLEIPGEKEFFIEFDPLSACKQNCSYVQLFTDMSMSSHAFSQFTNIVTNFPKEPLHYKNSPLYLYFYTDACANTQSVYGFKVKIHNGKNNSIVKMDDKFTSMMRSVCWVSCKCSAQLLRGNFAKALTSTDDEDLKYTNLLNSKLFAGGVDFEDIKKDNDKLLSNILEIFEKILPEENSLFSSHENFSPNKYTEKTILNNILNGEGLMINIILEAFQKKLSKEVVWAFIGGEQSDRLVRAAFAALLRHSGQTREFEELLDFLEFGEENENSEIQLDTETVIAKILTYPVTNSLYKKWQSASRMRSWLVEKNKNVDEALEKNKPNKQKIEEVKEANSSSPNSSQINKESSSENSSEEIMKKIIDQTIIKAKFLIKLNPSPAFQIESECDRLKEKGVSLVRSSSMEDPQSEDNWKLRLHQWKAVQKTKRVIKSVEEEAHEKLSSLTSSVLLCLQSSISSKRLFNKIKVSTIRAKGREIGLITIKNIFQKISHTALVEDLLSWFCASLRKTETKICHYLDGVSGCGLNFENRVQERFQDFIVLLINKLIKAEKPAELKSFIDALMWKYSTNDHKFLVEQGLFMILWGSYNEAIKETWGKSLKPSIVLPDEKTPITEIYEFTNSLLEVFEVLSNICLEKATHNPEKHLRIQEKAAKTNSQVNIKFPTLEKQVSILDESNSESLVRHVLDVIFGEVSKSIQSYLRNRGISHKLWKQYLQYEEEKLDEKKNKKEQANPLPVLNNQVRDTLELINNSIREEVLSDLDIVEHGLDSLQEEEKKEERKEEKKEGETTQNADTPYFYDPTDIITLYDELRVSDSKFSQKMNKKVYISANNLLQMIVSQNSTIYDSDFLNRLLTILYKCSAQPSEKILFSIANPLNFSSLLKLLRLCSTQNKILIAKILQNVCVTMPEEIMIEAIDIFIQSPEGDDFILEFCEKRKKYSDLDKRIFIELIIDITKEIKSKSWCKNFDSTAGYVVSNELIYLLRRMLLSEHWSAEMSELLLCLQDENSDHLRKEIVLSIYGGDHVGQANGSKVRVRQENTKGLNFDFIKKDFTEHFNYGTIVGFSGGLDEIWNKKQGKDNKKKTKKIPSVMLTPGNSVENQVAVLLHDSILKEEFNLMDLAPKVFSQHEVMIIQPEIHFDDKMKLSKESLTALLSYVVYDKCQTSESLNQKVTILRILNKLAQCEKGLQSLLELDNNYISDTLFELMLLSTKNIQHKSNYLNLDLLEEKRYRILNYCAENNYSLSEIPKIFLTFRKPNYLLVRLSSENLLNLTFPILGAINYENLLKIDDFFTFSVDKFGEDMSSEIIFISPENLEKYLDSNSSISKRLIVTYTVDLKSFESKTKKLDSISIITIDFSSFEEITNLYESLELRGIKLEDCETYKKAFPSKNKENESSNSQVNYQGNGQSSLISELEEFGFSRELIIKELSKTGEVLDINTLITNMIEYKERRKELEEKTDEEKQEFEKIEQEREDKENEDEIENETKNDCFNTADSENKIVIPEYFEEMIINETDDLTLLYKHFKSLNEKLIILYARRIMISLFNKILDKENLDKFDSVFSKVPSEIIIKLLKLLTHEGLFLNSINWGSDLLVKLKFVLTNIYTKKSNKCEEISKILTETTLKDLETVLQRKKQTYEFISRNEDAISQKPMIFFSLWNLMILNENSSAKVEYSFIFNVLSGLVTKIIENKQIRWFILDTLIQFVNRLLSKLRDDTTLNILGIKDRENLIKLRLFLDQSINKESKKNLSKRSQMICELLIYIDELDAKLKSVSGKLQDSELNNLISSDSKKDNFIKDLLTTFEMMKDFFDKKYIKYLAWTEMNPDIINTSKLTFESSHLYPKAPHTFLINVPNTTALEINLHSDSLLDNGDAVVFSSDKNCHYPIECFANRSSKKSFTIPSSHTFVHFPSNYLTEVYSFGSNTYSRLGQTGVEIFTPKLIESLSSVIVKDISIGDTFTMVLAQNGELLSAGNGTAAGLKQTSNSFVKASNIILPEKINSDGISLIGVNNGSTIVATKDYSLYSIGLNSFGQLGQNWVSPVNDITSMNFSKRLKQIVVGDTHSMLLTIDGDVYHIGNNDYYQSGESSATRNNTPKLLALNKSLTCEMMGAGEYFTIFVMKDIVTGKKKLYAAGWSKQGRTGTGKDEEYHGFKLISTQDLENVEFKSISCSKTSSLAISSNGKLYAWGSNHRGQLGLGHYNDVLEPTLVTFFEKYEILDASISTEHSLIIARDLEKSTIHVFGFGDSSNGKLGETITQKSEKKDTVPTPIRISYFEGRNPSRVITGCRASIVICKMKPYENLRDTHNVNCSLCSKITIIGNLFSEISEENTNTPKVYCNECIKIVDMSDKQPRLLLKTPLKEYSLLSSVCKSYSFTHSKDNIEDYTDLSSYSCKNCKSNLTNIHTTGAYMYLENKSKLFLCNQCIDIFPSCITSAKVYLRVFNVIKNIDITNINNFYDNSVSYGHKFTVTPILNEKGCEAVIEKHANSFLSFCEDITEFNKFEVYEQLVDLLNNIAQKAERSIFSYSPKELSFKKEELSVRNSLEKCTPEILRKMFVILKILNNKVKELLPFIDFSKVLQENQRLSFHFNKITPLIFWDTKNELIKYYLEKTAADHESSEIKINRMKVKKFIDKGKPDHTGEYTIFGLIFQFLKNKSFKIFRKKEGGNSNKMFSVTFVGEASIDAGGPYREAMTQACTELQSTALPLFTPSPNQKNESGLNREKWVINPSAKSTTHLDMYKILGGLIGYAMRTGEFLNLDLPSIFWKGLLESPIDRKDLELIDRYTIQCLDDIINIHKKGVQPENFSFYVDQKYTTCLSDSSEVELIPNGRNIDVTYNDRIKYCELVERIRLDESKIQMNAIRSGLEFVIPLGLLKLLSWKELETLVCGKPILDVDLLRDNTVYRVN